VSSKTVIFFVTAPDERSRSLLPSVRARASRLVIVAPAGRLRGPEAEGPGVVRVDFAGPIVAGPAWDRVRALLAVHLGRRSFAAVAVNDSGLGAYRDAAAAIAALGIPARRIAFLLPEGGVGDASPAVLSLADWRRREARAVWRSRIAAVARRAEIREIGLVALVATALGAIWGPVSHHAGLVSVALALSAHVLTWRYARATIGEYTGDAAIHYQFARRFARGDWFCYNPGAFSAGSSSPLWTLLLGCAARIGGERHLEAAGTGLAWLSLHLSLLVAAIAAMRVVGVDGLWGLAPIGLAASSRVFLWTGRAMDAPFALLMATLVTAAVTEDHAAAIAAAVALACLARWEHVVLLAPVVAWAAWHRGAWWPFVAFLPIAVLAADSARRLGSLVPASGRARRRYAALRPEAWRTEWGIWTARPDLWTLAAIGATAPALDPGVRIALVGWLVATVVFFTIIVPGTYDGRYLIPALAPFSLLAAVGGTRLFALTRGAWWEAAAVGLLAWTVARWVRTAWAELPAVRDAASRAAREERAFRRRVADGLAALLPPGATLAMVEVDLLWGMDRDDIRVVSLDGVLDATILPALEEGRLLPELARRHATHVLIETCLYDRPGWRELDVARLCEDVPAIAFGEAGVATALAAWPYRNWGDGRDEWPWRLWALAAAVERGDTCSR
jgi:hypothetical protein